MWFDKELIFHDFQPLEISQNTLHEKINTFVDLIRPNKYKVK